MAAAMPVGTFVDGVPLRCGRMLLSSSASRALQHIQDYCQQWQPYLSLLNTDPMKSASAWEKASAEAKEVSLQGQNHS